jgi:hypothetical protein
MWPAPPTEYRLGNGMHDGHMVHSSSHMRGLVPIVFRFGMLS